MENNQNYIVLKEADWDELKNQLVRIRELIESDNELNPFYREEELAELLGLSKKTLQTYRNNGQLGFVKPEGSRAIIYTKEQVVEFMKAHEFKTWNKGY
jgi:excisionase family DNA binding protein